MSHDSSWVVNEDPAYDLQILDSELDTIWAHSKIYAECLELVNKESAKEHDSMVTEYDIVNIKDLYQDCKEKSIDIEAVDERMHGIEK